MKTKQLLLSGLDISEDEYSFKAQFILSASGRSTSVDLESIEQTAILEELKDFFELEEDTDEIKKLLMDMVVEKAHVNSTIVEGENYEENSKKKKVERRARYLDMS
ncbi:MAG TPA: hypothetical protein VHT96_11530 [Clostridia bacterium]|nr:hypothetical protein [Clostridia bacterium]